MQAFGQVPFRVNRHQGRLSYKSANPLLPGSVAHLFEFVLHATNSQCGIVQEEPVDLLHQLLVLLGLSDRLVVQATAMDLEQIGLPANTESMQRVDMGSSFVHSPAFDKLFFKKSFSTFSWPICSNRVFTSTSSPLSFFPVGSKEHSAFS